MKSIHYGFCLILAVALSACGGTPTPSGPTLTPLATQGDEIAPTVTESVTLTAAPTTDALTTPTTPEPEALPPGVVIYQAGDPASIVVVDPSSGQIAPFFSPAPTILGGTQSVEALQGKIFAITPIGTVDNPTIISEITPAGVRSLIDAPNILLNIAVQRSSTSSDVILLAYSTSDGSTTRLQFTTVDGTEGELVAEQTTPEGYFFQPQRWSADGSRLYYSEERASPAGDFGLLSRFSTLYVYDVAAQASSVLIPYDVLNADFCLDDLSPDEALVAHHCADSGIGILDLENGSEVVVVQPPAEISNWALAGSTKFSPDSTRIAFAVMRGDPANEQGWVLVTDDLGGTSRLILTAPAGDYYTVEAWLDTNTLILQSQGESPAVWLLRLDGSDPVKLSDGTFLDLMR